MKTLSSRTNPLLDGFVPAASAWSFVSAVSVGIFDALAADGKSAAEIAQDLDLDLAGVERLMPVLAHLGYIECDEDRYRLSGVSLQCLTKDSEHRLSNWVRFCRTQLLAMSQLQSTLSTGRPVDLFDLMETPEKLRIHQLAMAETAMPVAGWVAEHTPVPTGGEMMLDVGGSHGLYSDAICRRNPPLRAEVMELPGIIEVARSVAHEFGAADVVTHIEGDILTTALTGEYSLVFFGNLIHHLPSTQLPGVFENVRNHLAPKGAIAIWDIDGDRETSDLVSSLFSLYFYLTSAARCHPQSRIQTALEEAGFDQFRVIKPDSPSMHTLYIARNTKS